MFGGLGGRLDMASIGKTTNRIHLLLQEGTAIAGVNSRHDGGQEKASLFSFFIQPHGHPLAPPIVSRTRSLWSKQSHITASASQRRGKGGSGVER